MVAMSNVRYGLSKTALAEWMELVRRLASRPDVVEVGDVGGGAGPILGREEAHSLGLAYTVMDVSATELAKAPAGYRTVVADVAADGFTPDRRYDLVLSRFVAEHIERPSVFHRNVLRMLRPGGWATHYFPTLYAPPFLFNKLVPERVSDPLLHRLAEERDDAGPQGKFPAHYRWCRGPSRRQLERLRSTGFEVEDYAGFFGFGGYSPVRAVERLEDAFSALLVRRPVWWYTAYAYVLLRRPGDP